MRVLGALATVACGVFWLSSCDQSGPSYGRIRSALTGSAGSDAGASDAPTSADLSTHSLSPDPSTTVKLAQPATVDGELARIWGPAVAVAIATPTAKQSRTAPFPIQVVTDITIAPSQAIWGTAPSVVTTRGGTVGTLTVIAAETPTVELGRPYLMFVGNDSGELALIEARPMIDSTHFDLIGQSVAIAHLQSLIPTTGVP